MLIKIYKTDPVTYIIIGYENDEAIFACKLDYLTREECNCFFVSLKPKRLMFSSKYVKLDIHNLDIESFTDFVQKLQGRETKLYKARNKVKLMEYITKLKHYAEKRGEEVDRIRLSI